MIAPRKLLVAAALSLVLPTLAAAQGAEAKPAETKPATVTITPYGFILAAGFFSDTAFGTQAYGGTPVALTQTPQMDYPGFAMGGPGGVFFSARQTRLGLRFDFPEALGATVKAVAEADFKGGYAGTSSNNNQAYVPVPRLRIAWITATWKTGFGNVGVGGGQEYGLVNPLFATSSAWVADPIFYYAGNLWRRSTQLRVFGDVGLPSSLGVNWAAAVLDPIDNVSGTPQDYGPGNKSRFADVEARVAVNYKMDKKLVAEVGAGWHYGRERYYPEGLASVDVAKRLVGIDAQVNLPVPVVPISLKGEWFTGSNLDTYWGDFGVGVKGAPSTASPASIPTGISSTGYWAQAVLQPFNVLQLVGGLGMEDPKDSDLAAANQVTTPGQIPTVKTKNQMVEAGVIFTPSKSWRAGVEWCRTKTGYRDAASRTGNQIAVSTALTF